MGICTQWRWLLLQLAKCTYRNAFLESHRMCEPSQDGHYPSLSAATRILFFSMFALIHSRFKRPSPLVCPHNIPVHVHKHSTRLFNIHHRVHTLTERNESECRWSYDSLCIVLYLWGGHCCPMHCDLFEIYCAPLNLGIRT